MAAIEPQRVGIDPGFSLEGFPSYRLRPWSQEIEAKCQAKFGELLTQSPMEAGGTVLRPEEETIDQDMD